MLQIILILKPVMHGSTRHSKLNSPEIEYMHSDFQIKQGRVSKTTIRSGVTKDFQYALFPLE